MFLYIVDLNRKKKYKQTKQIHNHQAETSKKDFSMASTSSTVYLMYFSGFFVNGKLEYLEKKNKGTKIQAIKKDILQIAKISRIYIQKTLVVY